MFGAFAPTVSGASSRVRPNTCPTSLAVAPNTVGEAISWPDGGPSGCNCWMTTDLPAESMKVRSSGSVAGGGDVGATPPEKPVMIGSPGAKIASAARTATRLRGETSNPAATTAAVDQTLTVFNVDSDTVASP